MLTTPQLQEFYRRVQRASIQGYTIALSAEYAADLIEETGLSDLRDSNSDLIALCEAALEGRAGTKPAGKSKKKAAEPVLEKPVTPELPPEPPPAPEPPAEVLVAKEPEPVTVQEMPVPVESELPTVPVLPEPTPELEATRPQYESWTRDQLREEAKTLGIEGSSKMNKVELLAAIQASQTKAP